MPAVAPVISAVGIRANPTDGLGGHWWLWRLRVLPLLQGGRDLGQVGQQVLEALRRRADRRGGEHPRVLGPQHLDVLADGVAGRGQPLGEQGPHGGGVGDERPALPDLLQQVQPALLVGPAGRRQAQLDRAPAAGSCSCTAATTELTRPACSWSNA